MSQVALASRRTYSSDDLWEAYTTTGSAEARDRLVLHYAGLVTYVAARLGSDLPSSVDYSDLIQSGVIGLIDAVARFQPERGLKFETYAVPRIRGAIIDELRSLDWAPRSVRRRARDLEAATEDCRRRLNRAPSSMELSEALDITIAELHRLRAQVGQTRVNSLDELLSSDLSGEHTSLAETLADPLAERPGDAFDERQLHEALQDSLAALTERERAVLVHSYLDGLTLAQIGKLLGVTESRVSQLRSAALKRVRVELTARLAD